MVTCFIGIPHVSLHHHRYRCKLSGVFFQPKLRKVQQIKTMEILVVLLAELLTPIVIPAGMGAFALLWCIIELPFMLLEMILTLIIDGSLDAWNKRRQARSQQGSTLSVEEKTIKNEETDPEEKIPPVEPTPARSESVIPISPKRKRHLIFRFAQWGAVACVAILLLLILTVTIVNAFFFESLLRYSIRNTESRTKISVDFDKASGSLWTGKVKLDNIAVRRLKHPTSQFDLKGKTVELDLSVIKMLRWSFVFESVNISGFEGTWEQVGKSVQLKPRRNFRIERLTMDAVQFEFIDRTQEKPFQATLVIDSMESTPLRSNMAMFDLMFRSRAKGTVNKLPFVVDSEKGKHYFRMEQVPIRLFSPYIGVLDWFETGNVDILIEDAFEGKDVKIQWSLVFHDFHVKAPEGTSLKVKAAMLPLTGLMNRKSERLPLEFELLMKENDFRFKSSTEMSDFVRTVTGDKIMDGIKKIKDRFKKEDDER